MTLALDAPDDQKSRSADRPDLRRASATEQLASGPRPLCYWTERYPPGWQSRLFVKDADPIVLAAEIQRLASGFVAWLGLSPQQRWDTHWLQALSAALFNRYRDDSHCGPSGAAASDVGLLELNWPVGSESIRDRVAEIQQLLVAPFAVFKVVRVAANADDFPTKEELRTAEETLLTRLPELAPLIVQLEKSLQQYALPSPLAAR